MAVSGSPYGTPPAALHRMSASRNAPRRLSLGDQLTEAPVGRTRGARCIGRVQAKAAVVVASRMALTPQLETYYEHFFVLGEGFTPEAVLVRAIDELERPRRS